MELLVKEINNSYQFDSNFWKAWVTFGESVNKDHLTSPRPYPPSPVSVICYQRNRYMATWNSVADKKLSKKQGYGYVFSKTLLIHTELLFIQLYQQCHSHQFLLLCT